MMTFKLAAITTLMTASAYIYAAPTMNSGKFGISNRTTYDLYFSVNNSCSNDIGHVSAYDIKSVPASNIIDSCSGSALCEIIGYDGSNCTGNAVGGVKINFEHHIMELIQGNNNKIGVGGSIGFSEYNIFLEEQGQVSP